MISVARALRIIDQNLYSLGTERIDLKCAVGRILAENIVADTDLPPFDRSQMDGYAVRSRDTKNVPVTLKIVGESAAGRGWHKQLHNGQAVRIMTGAPVPKGSDAVQKLEAAAEQNGFVILHEPTQTGRFIVKKGAEIRKGMTILKKGELLTPANIAVPAAFGHAKVSAAKRPRVAIFSTGTEIVDINKKPKRDQIRNSNSIMLAALCRSAGAEPTAYPIIGDDLSSLKSQISSAIRSADVLITTGGVSVGKYDLTKLALKELGAEIFFDKVALKPGKPTVFGKLKKTFIFGLPGNPVSAAVTFHLFVRRLIGRMTSAATVGLSSDLAFLLETVKAPKERDAYLPALLCVGPELRPGVKPLPWQGSSDFVSFADADVLIHIPKGRTVEANEIVEIVHLH
jgi:molybdenum cofactor synthesis domain-containing protein